MSERRAAEEHTDSALIAAAFPNLTPGQFTRMISYGTPEDVAAGDLIFEAGDAVADLVVIESGGIEIVQPATVNAPEDVVARHGPGRFVGELNMLTGQFVYLTARVVQPGRIYRIPPRRFRELMGTDPELSDLILRAFIARRERLRGGGAAKGIEIIGSTVSAAALALRTYASRQQLPHLWLEADSLSGQALMSLVSLTGADLPAVVTPAQVLKRATPGELAEQLGLSYRRTGDNPVDLAIVGAGPAGLAAAVYGASEGLDTVLLDSVGTGGQAAASSRIENYLGFPSGLSGQDLTGRAAVQALKFGAKIFTPCLVADLDPDGEHLRVVLDDGNEFLARAVVVATGAYYRSLPLPRWKDFEGAGIYYAATELEARAVAGKPVAVVGGANSAGQAALYLAARGCPVTLLVRGPDLGAQMSAYLADRLHVHPNVGIHTRSEITEISGDDHLAIITVTNRSTGETTTQPCSGLFCFIGARPATSWLRGVAVEDDGFIRTDVQLRPHDLGPTWSSLGRGPLPFETCIPCVFAVGDVRSGSMKRVAAAVGEGASAVQSVHHAIGVHL